MSNIKYTFVNDLGIGQLEDGTSFLFDKNKFYRIQDINLYKNKNDVKATNVYIVSKRGIALHRYLFDCPPGYELDHINNNTFDNRACNIRVCTHQQNQINQPLQKNNVSGYAGVSFYPPRNQYRARLKINQQEVHLGYFNTKEDAIYARQIGERCLFGEYGKAAKVYDGPQWIKDKVINKCKRYAHLSMNPMFIELTIEGVA